MHLQLLYGFVLKIDLEFFLLSLILCTCLLVLGIRNIDNKLVAYLPNSTNTNIGVNIIGSPMAQVINGYILHLHGVIKIKLNFINQTALQGRNNNAIKLNNGYGEPMAITLGMYRGSS